MQKNPPIVQVENMGRLGIYEAIGCIEWFAKILYMFVDTAFSAKYSVWYILDRLGHHMHSSTYKIKRKILVCSSLMQVYRLQNQIVLALADLDTAIRLSSGHGKVAEQAHTQRGLLRRLRGDDEGALDDFKAAAKLGSKFAQRQVVAMNPYSALCNQMLSEAFGKLRRGEAV